MNKYNRLHKKTNELKIERIRKRYAISTRFPRPIGYRKDRRRWLRTHRAMEQLTEGVGVVDPPDAPVTGESDREIPCAPSPAEGQPPECAEHPASIKIGQEPEWLAYVFRYSKRQSFQVGDTVQVKRWGCGQIVGFYQERAIVSDENRTASFPFTRCQIVSADRGMNWSDFYQYQKEHGIAGKSVVWHRKGQFFSDMPPFRFAHAKGL